MALKCLRSMADMKNAVLATRGRTNDLMLTLLSNSDLHFLEVDALVYMSMASNKLFHVRLKML